MKEVEGDDALPGALAYTEEHTAAGATSGGPRRGCRSSHTDMTLSVGPILAETQTEADVLLSGEDEAETTVEELEGA